MNTQRLLVMVGAASLGVLLWIGIVAAHDAPVSLVLATNTPPATLPGFATNTPQPTLDLPQAAFERYALRLWDEPTLTGILLAQVQQLRPGDEDRKLAIRLLQHELQMRFPGAPHDPGVRQQLIDAMLAAPRASVDMRAEVRPFIESALNQIQPSFLGVSSFDFQGFNITIMPANFNGDISTDAMIQTRYPALVSNPAEIRYQDFVAAQMDNSGVYHVLEADSQFPVAPLDNVQSINLERLGDLNQDGLDEFAVSTRSTGSANQQLQIFGWRNNGIVNLVVPGRVLQFGAIADWTQGSDTLTVTEYRVESPAWNCLGERDLTWKWQFNFFRPPEKADDFTFQNRLACLLYGAEPLFEQPVDEAINAIENILPLAQPDDEAAVQRAAMLVAMLRVLNGDTNEALDQVHGLQNQAGAGTWLADQTAAFLNAAQTEITPLQLCASLQEADTYGACDVDAVLTRLFKDQPLNRDESLESQLARLGITVSDTQTISAVGKMNRQVVHFVLAGDHWWAFAPLKKNAYVAEKLEPPPGSIPGAPPPSVIAPPDTAFRALLDDSDPKAVLNILDNLVHNNPGASLASSGRFLRAFTYDLLGDRGDARQSYFTLWSDDPGSLWGQLAAAHLEQR